MKRHAGLLAELFALSWRRVPGLTTAVLCAHALTVVTAVGTALGLRNTVDAILRGDTAPSVVWAVSTACLYGLAAAVDDTIDTLRILAVEKVGMADMTERIQTDLVSLEGLEHLERPDYLDRLTTVRTSAWRLMFGLWSAVGAVFDMIQLVILLALLGTVSPWLSGLLLFAAVPLLADRKGRKVVIDAELRTAETSRLQRHLFRLTTDAACGKEVRVSAAAPELVRRLGAAWQEVTAERYRARVVAALWQVGGWIVFTAGFSTGLALVLYRAVQGRGTVGDIVLSVTVVVALRQSVQTGVGRVTHAAAAGKLIEPYLWLRDYAAADRARTAATETVPERLRHGITFDAVSYTYPGTNRKALDDVSVHLPTGSVVAVVGEFGSGKTTLVKLLAKFYRPDSGAVRVDGIDLGDLDTGAWRERSSAVFQDFGRFQTLFAEAVGLGDLAALDDRERVMAAVREADAQTLVDRLPDGLDTRLGRTLDGVDLSEGQWQKTALSRGTMRRQPLLFVMDEPTASLDAPSEQKIFQRYMERARDLAARSGAITVVISHRFSTVTGADLILVLDKGKLQEQGTHKELMALGGRYAELYGLQERAYSLDPAHDAPRRTSP